MMDTTQAENSEITSKNKQVFNCPQVVIKDSHLHLYRIEYDCSLYFGCSHGLHYNHVRL